MENVAIYCRVSTQRQEKEKTIESQIAELREICKKHKVKIVKEYIDNGWSGTTLARPNLDELRDDLPKGLWERLYIIHLDRLSRPEKDDVDLQILLREFKNNNIEVFAGERQLTDKNEIQTDFETLLAKYTRKDYLDKTRRGKLHKAKGGKIMRCPNPPFGYRFVEDKKDEDNKDKKRKEWKLEENPEEAKIVRTAFKFYVQYQSTYRVVKELDKRGYRTRHNCHLRTIKIHRMLRNETYIGKWYYGKYQSVEPENPQKKYRKVVKSSCKKRKEWIEIKIPAIIDESLFENVQELLKKNYKLYGKRENNPYLLTGVLRCVECGGRMIGFSRYKKYRYYRCYNRQLKFPQKRTCSNGKYVYMEDLDKEVWKKIKGVLQNPKMLLKYASYLNNKDKDRKALEEEKRELEQEKVQIKQQIDRDFELYEVNEIDKDKIAERITDHTQVEKSKEKLIKEIDMRLKQMENKSIIIQRLKDISKVSKVQLDIMSPKEKNEFLKSIIQKVAYNHKTGVVDIEGHIPLFEIEKQEEMMTLSLPILNPLSTPRGIVKS